MTNVRQVVKQIESLKAKFDGLISDLSTELAIKTKQMDTALTEFRFMQKKTISLEESLSALQNKNSKLREEVLGRVYGFNTNEPKFQDNTELMLSSLGKGAVKDITSSNVCHYSPEAQVQVLALLRFKVLTPDHFSSLFHHDGGNFFES